jgi:hypothetical protein
MRIDLHIGFEHAGANRVQDLLVEHRAQLLTRGHLFPSSPGARNHVRLFMAITDPDHIDPLRHRRGYETAEKQKVLYQSVCDDLAREIDTLRPERLVLSCTQLGESLWRTSEVLRLKSMLTSLCDDVRVLVQVAEPARMLASHYAAQVMEGRSVSLDRDLALMADTDWWNACLDANPETAPDAGVFEETQGAPFWLDFQALSSHWDGVFGAGATRFFSHDQKLLYSDRASEALVEMLDLEQPLGPSQPAPMPKRPSAAHVTRARLMNELLLQVQASGTRSVPHQLWKNLLSDIKVEGDAIDPFSLPFVSQRFASSYRSVMGRPPAQAPQSTVPTHWTEADPEFGFRATQYLLAFWWRIENANRKAPEPPVAPTSPKTPPEPTPHARTILPPAAIQHYEKLVKSPMAPHNLIGSTSEDMPAAPYAVAPANILPKGSSGTVIVGCMKNEAPYILEWIAHHRAIGVDNFLIYTNDCSDGTAELLNCLQDMGVVQHRDNTTWKGKSPQQHALNMSLNEPLIRNADWIIHIDVDEFINVRTGNGTLRDFIDLVPDATNIAMTWRLFGHNGKTRLTDALVTEQFDTCAPKYCPKPHTVWGFKTMFRNIGAYQKISCHRPNKLLQDAENKVKWVNGSGQDMTGEVARNGWRNSRKSIGYDLLQLNHYALRSADSFLIKRQRGRALHVDRSIGINYWVRMDWSVHRDTTIQRNIPRLTLERDRLLQNDRLRALHQAGFAWHVAKAAELHRLPEFAELYAQAVDMRLTATERVAYALALDTDT